MSTRSCIARLTGPASFCGVYHHWDGYPTALGKTLWELYHGFFDRNLEKMLSYLIDDHPAGWSTINGADFALPPGFSDKRPCRHCFREYVDHLEWPEGTGPGMGVPAIGNKALGHTYEYDDTPPAPPQCFCHGDRQEEASPIDQDADSGMEWAYVFDVKRRRLLVFERLYKDSHDHMVGMFGAGAPGNQYWAPAADLSLDGPGPDWERISAIHYGSRLK